MVTETFTYKMKLRILVLTIILIRLRCCSTANTSNYIHFLITIKRQKCEMTEQSEMIEKSEM